MPINKCKENEWKKKPLEWIKRMRSKSSALGRKFVFPHSRKQ